MNLRRLLTLKAVVALLFGFCFAAVPGPLAAIYGLRLDGAGTFVAQLFGASLLGFGALNWWARQGNSGDAASLQPIVMANLIGDGLGFCLSLLNQVFGWSGINAFGWLTVAIYLLLALGFAYYGFVPQPRVLSNAPQ
jgi:hypothetical protein